MNYEAERAMNQKRLRMDGEPGHGVVQGNGLPLNYIDNGHQIPYQPYAGAYNTHYPPPDAFATYGPPPPGGYAPQNLSYAPPAHQNYPHHQSFAQQPQQLHMPQSHMVQGYGDVVHKPAWPHQPHLLPPLDAQKLDVKQLKPEIKVEPADALKRPHPDTELMSGRDARLLPRTLPEAALAPPLQGGDLDQPKIKIKTDIFKPDDLAHRPGLDKPIDVAQKDASLKPTDLQNKDEGQPNIADIKASDMKPTEAAKAEDIKTDVPSAAEPSALAKSEEDRKPFSPEPKLGAAPVRTPSSGDGSPKKRGRPKGSTNKPKAPGAPRGPPSTPAGRPPAPPRAPAAMPRPRAPTYQYAVRPFRKDFSGIQFRRRWSDDCLESGHIPNEVYFGDVPVPPEVLHNYYDANAERERLAAQAAHIAAQKAAAAKLAAAKLQARGILSNEVTTVDSSSSDDSSGESGSDSDDSDEDQPLKRGPGRPKGTKNSPRPPGAPPGRRGRPPVPPEMRQPGITEMKKFCKAAGIRFDYKKLVEGCTKNKERVGKMMELLTNAGLQGSKPTLEACRALKQARVDKKNADKQAKKEAKTKVVKEDGESETSVSRRMTRGATGVKPRQRIVISSDEEDGTPAARRTLSKLRSSVNDDSDSD